MKNRLIKFYKESPLAFGVVIFFINLFFGTWIVKETYGWLLFPVTVSYLIVFGISVNIIVYNLSKSKGGL